MHMLPFHLRKLHKLVRRLLLRPVTTEKILVLHSPFLSSMVSKIDFLQIIWHTNHHSHSVDSSTECTLAAKDSLRESRANISGMGQNLT